MCRRNRPVSRCGRFGAGYSSPRFRAKGLASGEAGAYQHDLHGLCKSEVLSWLGKGKKIEDILMGVHQSIAKRSIGLLRRVGIEDQVTFTGGVAKNNGMIYALEENMEIKLNVSEESHYMGALGAALFAMDHIMSSRVPLGAMEAVS
jgi:activator of 2-hydroxyglutaryl-CoA dehydratase